MAQFDCGMYNQEDKFKYLKDILMVYVKYTFHQTLPNLYPAQKIKQSEYEGHSDIITGMQLSSDGSKIVSFSYDKTIQIWDLSSGKKLLLNGHLRKVNGIQFSSDNSKIVSYSRDQTIRLWDVLWIQNYVKFLDYTIRLWDVLSGKQLLLLKGHSDWVTDAQFSLDGSKIVSCSSDKTIRLWNVSSGKQIQLLKGHSSPINGIQLAPNGSKIISYSKDKTIRIWDMDSGKQIQALEGHTGDIKGIQLSPDGYKLASCSDDRTVRLWSCDNNRITDVIETKLVKCAWQAGVQSLGLSMKNSIWKNTNGLTSQQKLLIEQRGGNF
ncbi:hypothetical protein RFI_02015 [Reticulomyxa filosa]|uniref:Uncharacterized protein n=1 Tax=Reticulomyxa filosa TaxID=46433 RepID=X6PAA0_RETFI|nr:hypothetical protein RFI_02015 [Reticulomyxa filosa]|eukprot:ETO35058.1 hypothetical protein RFI_02015 [Reticulomyxa filosa]